MTRLGRRLIAIVAIGLAVGIAIPAVALVNQRQERREAERDARLARIGLATLITVPEGRDGRIDLDAYVQGTRPPDTPLTAVLGRSGRVIAFDRKVPADIVETGFRRTVRGDDDPVTVGDHRLVALSVEGKNGQIGSVLAYEPLSRIDSNDAWLIGGIAFAWWLILVGITALLVSRTLGPASRAAAREEAFLADAAHELRTPLAVVQGRADRARRDGATPEDLEAISAAAAGAAQTITDMLDLARLDAGRAMVERTPLRLDALVTTCADDLETDVEVRLDPMEAVVVEGDERLLARAVTNLLENAVRHGGAGGVVDVSVQRTDGFARVRVADAGPGIAPGQREHVFERFHRGGAKAPGGSGLGLPIARLIAEAHGGTLTLDPADPARPGASFTLSLRPSQ